MRYFRWLWLPGLVALLIAVVGCGGESRDSKEKAYDIEGTVVSVDLDKKKVTLDHKDIPGLMKGMKMPFSIEDTKMLTDIKSGDQVRGRLKVKTGEYIITELHKQ